MTRSRVVHKYRATAEEVQAITEGAQQLQATISNFYRGEGRQVWEDYDLPISVDDTLSAREWDEENDKFTGVIAPMRRIARVDYSEDGETLILTLQPS